MMKTAVKGGGRKGNRFTLLHCHVASSGIEVIYSEMLIVSRIYPNPVHTNL